MRRIHGIVQHYAWGDHTALPQLLGQEPDGLPWAEWWLGTHAGGPATTADGAPLAAVAGELPYLLKVLAAREALSLQTHPDTATAQAGFAREQQAGIALTDPRRVYRDPFAKPELLCALSPFDALCGFRPVAATVQLLREVGALELAEALQRDGLQATVAGLYQGTIAAAPAVAACRLHDSPEATLVTLLDDVYPDEPSVAVTLLLNRVRLMPGEAIYLGPGNLHAYLYGVGVEIMGASDNVVRGGLTVKHVDVPELLRVLRYEPLADPVVRATEEQPGRWRYATPDAPFELWRFDVTGRMTHTAAGRELLLCTEGDSGPLRRGQAAYLALGESTVLEGPCTVFRIAEGDTGTAEASA
ncbi:MAG: mannose-6-phosphate isomerase, class I [Actinomycetota bacterium]|nr:mannose-6-phosphate isomerase, class I [Actinomycetota bacterium]